MALRLSRGLIARRFSPVYADSEVVLFSARVLRARAQTVTCALGCTRTHARNRARTRVRARTRKRAPACTGMNAQARTGLLPGPGAIWVARAGGQKAGTMTELAPCSQRPQARAQWQAPGAPRLRVFNRHGSMLGSSRVEAGSMHKEPLYYYCCCCLLRATRLRRNRKLDGSNAQAGLRSSRRPIAAAACHCHGNSTSSTVTLNREAFHIPENLRFRL